jgi:hypothetical protein
MNFNFKSLKPAAQHGLRDFFMQHRCRPGAASRLGFRETIGCARLSKRSFLVPT